MKKNERVEIIHANGCYVAYVDGEFYCSGDTYNEVIQELTDDGIFK